MSVRPASLSALAALLSLLALPAAAASPHLERCRSLEGEFDYKGMVAECTLVAGDKDAEPEERVEAHRLLGFAHTALGDDDAAREWFVRLLVLDPDHALPSEVSPRFREVFARAVDHVKQKGRVTVAHQPPTAEASLAGEPLRLSFEVSDALERISSAHLIVDAIVDGEVSDPVTAPLVKMPSEGEGAVRFEGKLPDPPAESGAPPVSYTLRYRLVLLGPLAHEVPADPPVPPIMLPRRGATVDVVATEDEGLVLWGSAALASSLVVAGLVGGGIALYCATGRCSSREVQPPVGYVNVSVDGAAGVLP